MVRTFYVVVEKRPRSVWLNIYYDKNHKDRYLFDVFDSMDEAISYTKDRLKGDKLFLTIKGRIAA
ncbi:MAG: hypothetical protein ILA15_11670 [Clostridiales bacterium]|nr:hypothetical protein [Clostridiales bacterium]